MLRSFIITSGITALLLVSACTSQPKIDPSSAPSEPGTRNRERYSAPIETAPFPLIDTILERNNPANLDSEKHQLFIDTTRNSRYYDQLISWKPNESDKGGIDYYLGQIGSKFNINHVDLKSFPKKWISIHKLNDTFYTYNPMNGIDWRMTLTDSSVNYYAIESDADAISELVSISDNELILKLRSSYDKNNFSPSYMRIKRSKFPHIYTLMYSISLTFLAEEKVRLITPIENLKYYDLIVSDSPNLVFSSVQFDSVRLMDIDSND